MTDQDLIGIVTWYTLGTDTLYSQDKLQELIEQYGALLPIKQPPKAYDIFRRAITLWSKRQNLSKPQDVSNAEIIAKKFDEGTIFMDRKTNEIDVMPNPENTWAQNKHICDGAEWISDYVINESDSITAGALRDAIVQAIELLGGFSLSEGKAGIWFIPSVSKDDFINLRNVLIKAGATIDYLEITDSKVNRGLARRYAGKNLFILTNDVDHLSYNTIYKSHELTTVEITNAQKSLADAQTFFDKNQTIINSLQYIISSTQKELDKAIEYAAEKIDEEIKQEQEEWE